jgi:hypothetical protein
VEQNISVTLEVQGALVFVRLTRESGDLPAVRYGIGCRCWSVCLAPEERQQSLIVVKVTELGHSRTGICMPMQTWVLLASLGKKSFWFAVCKVLPALGAGRIVCESDDGQRRRSLDSDGVGFKQTDACPSKFPATVRRIAGGMFCAKDCVCVTDAGQTRVRTYGLWRACRACVAARPDEWFIEQPTHMCGSRGGRDDWFRRATDAIGGVCPARGYEQEQWLQCSEDR